MKESTENEKSMPLKKNEKSFIDNILKTLNRMQIDPEFAAQMAKKVS